MSYDSFLEEVYETGTPRDTKADAVEYYQQKYPGLGRGGWKRHLVNDLLAWQDITPGSVGDVEYKRLSKNMDKRFEKRLNNLEPRNAEQYREFGKTLPPKPPEGRGHVWGTIWVKYSDDCVDREVDIDISSEDVRGFFAMSINEMVQAVSNGYQSDKLGDADINFKGPSVCDAPDLHFELIEA